MNVQFVAEIASNHNRDLERCFQFIDTAAEIGCSAVKFQLFQVSKLFAPEVLVRSAKHRARKNWELPKDFLPALASRCERRGIQFGCTPFYMEAVEELFDYVHFYKISSYELLWDDLLQACGRTGKPVVLSTGMASLQEVKHAVKVIQQSGCEDLALLHCASEYPASALACNLSAIQTLRSNFAGEVGWSDHSVDPGVIYRAVHRWGARLIEFHLDLDGAGCEFEDGFCWLPEKIQQVIADVRSGLAADGNGVKKPGAGEIGEAAWRADPSDGLRPLRTTRLTFSDDDPVSLPDLAQRSLLDTGTVKNVYSAEVNSV